jgi:hypothetical protein
MMLTAPRKVRTRDLVAGAQPRRLHRDEEQRKIDGQGRGQKMMWKAIVKAN